MKNSSDTSWHRTSDLPICSTAPWPPCHRGPRKRRGINWNISEQLEDMAFVGDMCHLSETVVDMEKKLRDLQSEGRITRLQTVRNWVTQNQCKKWQNIQKEVWMYWRSKQICMLGHCDGQHWWGSGRCKNMDSEGKLQLLLNLIKYENVGRWSIAVKLWIFRRNVKSFLLYGCKTLEGYKQYHKIPADLYEEVH